MRVVKVVTSTLQGEKGFSLMELLVVMIILGLLASLVAPKVFKKLGMAKEKTARSQISLLMSALDQYRLDVGRYPSQQQGLKALRTNVGNEKNWDGPYVPNDIPKDPWGNSYIYKNPGTHGDIDVYSLGADGQSGGTGDAADIGSWQTN